MQRDRITGIDKKFINDYRINTPDAGNPLSDEERVEKLLGKEVMNNVLHEGTASGVKENREKFVALLNEVLIDRNNDMVKQGNSPAEDAVPLEKLLGKNGVELYKKAIEEERNSREFRNAVFLKSTKHYEGKKWDKQLIMWVGGPSASGKSYGANAAVKAVGDSVMKKMRPDNREGNDVVSIDGGVEREVSQMRQLVLQVAIKKGYPGIKDLHANTKLNIKPTVRKAALAARMNVVIPETFANPIAMSKLKKYDKIENSVQVFSEVTPAAGMDDNFQMTVERMGNERAWKSKYGKEHSKDSAVTFNNYHIGVESKNYNKKFFQHGKKGSLNERDEYMKVSKDKVYVGIVNDLIYVNKEGGNWKQCTDIKEKGEMKLSVRDFQAWQEQRKTSNAIPDLPQWLEIQKQNNNLAKLDVNIVVRGKEYTEGKMLALETAVNALYETSRSASSPAGSRHSGTLDSLKKGIGNRFSQVLRSGKSSPVSSEIGTSEKTWQNVLDGFKPLIPEIMNSDESPDKKAKLLDKLDALLDDVKRYDSGDSQSIKESIAKVEKAIHTSRDRLEGKSVLSSSSESGIEKRNSASEKDDDSYLQFMSDIAETLTTAPARGRRQGQSSSASIALALNGGKKPERAAPVPVQETRPRRMGGEKPPQPVKPAVNAEPKPNEAQKVGQSEPEATTPSRRLK